MLLTVLSATGRCHARHFSETQDYEGHTGICPDIAPEQTSNTAKGLVEVVTLLQWVADSLEDLLVLFRMLVVHLLRCGNVLLDVAASVLPRLQTLVEQLGGLTAVLVGDGIVTIGSVGEGTGRDLGLAAGSGCGRRHGEKCW